MPDCRLQRRDDRAHRPLSAVRDLALFVGSPDDIVPDRFGQDLPFIRSWTEEHYRFPGYVTGFDPFSIVDRDQIRDELGTVPTRRSVSSQWAAPASGATCCAAWSMPTPRASERVPGLRMVIVTGPRIDPASSASSGVDVRSYVPELYRYLAASDLAVVQGGLTTCMELTATKRPFIYVPLAQHFEQNFHVHHRFQRHRAGRRMDFADSEPDVLAEAIALEINRADGRLSNDRDRRRRPRRRPPGRTHLSSARSPPASPGRRAAHAAARAPRRAARPGPVRPGPAPARPAGSSARPSAASAAARAAVHGSRSATASSGASTARARSGSPCASHASASDR